MSSFYIIFGVICAGIVGAIIFVRILWLETKKVKVYDCYGKHEVGDIHIVRGCDYCIDHLQCLQISEASAKKVVHLTRIK